MSSRPRTLNLSTRMAFAIESQLNELADRLDMSPIEIRRVNGMIDGERTPIGQTLWDIGFFQTLDAIEPIYEQRKRALASQDVNGDGRKRGLGIACLGYGIGYSGARNPSTARMRVDARGVVTAYCGTPDIGTGSDVSVAQIAAQTAGIDVRRVRVVRGDSTKTDDRSARACCSRDRRTAGAVTTVEALERDGALSPLQQAFLTHGATHCGYCTPGFLMTATALLEENPAPNRADIVEVLKGNLCRCTGYKKIVEAVESVAARRITDGERPRA